MLISTSVLDNGINLNNIDHVVASGLDKVQILQMVGRARKTTENQRKTLYLKRPDKVHVERRIAHLEEQKEAYHKFNLAYGTPTNPLLSRGSSIYDFQMEYYHGSQEKWTNAIHWFGISKKDCELHWNEIARSMLEPRIRQYKFILEEMLKEDIPGQKYLEHQLSWFGKTYSRDNDITYCDKEKALNELNAFLGRFARNRISIDAKIRKYFQNEFMHLFEAAFYKAEKNKRLSGANKMNKLLTAENLNFRIDGPPNKGPWIVVFKTETFSTTSNGLTTTDTKPQDYGKHINTRELMKVISEVARKKNKTFKSKYGSSKHKRTTSQEALQKNNPNNSTTHPTAKTPNPTTAKVVNEAAIGQNMSKQFDSVPELMEDLER